MKGLDLEFGGQNFTATPHGGLFWKERECLLVADLHLGKPASLRAQGVAIPEGPTEETLSALAGEMGSLGTKVVVVLGDLWHDATGMNSVTASTLDDWISATHTTLKLVPGNHDRGCLNKLSGMRLTLLDEVVQWNTIHLVHEARPDLKPSISGHVHPTFRLANRVRLKAFIQQHEQLILPAYGAFTGGLDYSKVAADRVFVSTGTSIRLLPSR